MRIRHIALTIVLVLAGCSDDGDDGGGDGALSTTTSAAADTSSSTAAPATGDQAVVERIVLQQSDFPAGWTAEPADDDEDEAGDRKVAACVGVEFDPDRPKARSPQFSQGELIQATSSSELAPEPAVAAAELAALRGPKASECIEVAFAEQVAESASGASFSPAQVEVREAPKLGDDAHALRLTTGVSTPDGSNVPIFADYIFMQKGRAEISLVGIGAGQPFDPALFSALAQKLASRA